MCEVGCVEVACPRVGQAREGLKSVHILAAHNHKFEFYKDGKAGGHGEIAADAKAAEREAERAPERSKPKPKPTGRPMFGGGLYAEESEAVDVSPSAVKPTVRYLQDEAAWAACLAAAGAADRLVVVDFTASWCGPCQQIAPMYEQLAARYTSVEFVKVDVDRNQEVAAQQQITAMPTFKLYRRGATVASIKGADVGGLVGLIEAHAGNARNPTAADRRHDLTVARISPSRGSHRRAELTGVRISPACGSHRRADLTGVRCPSWQVLPPVRGEGASWTTTTTTTTGP
jgi:thioredoxin